MKKREVAPNVFLIEFPTSQEAAMTFLRFQEHYESPKFKNKIFTLAEYIKWYTKRTKRPFSYYEDWSGFNIPSCVLMPFYQGRFSGLTQNELRLLELFEKEVGQYYVIGCAKGKSDTLRHEIMHGVYYTNPQYRMEVDRILYGVNCKKIHQILIDYGYHKDVLQDETHAYLVTCQAALGEYVDLKKYKDVIRKLKRNYDKFMGA